MVFLVINTIKTYGFTQLTAYQYFLQIKVKGMLQPYIVEEKA
tara:strand:- start:540 stop:665 length:126 start_codon:yes stop_codon:yes gene_type:complete